MSPITSRAHQREPVDQLVRHLVDGAEDVVLRAATGTGKTWMAAEAARRSGLRLVYATVTMTSPARWTVTSPRPSW